MTADTAGFKYLGFVATTVVDPRMLLWMCERDGLVVADQGLHERSAHPREEPGTEARLRAIFGPREEDA